jgi:hypothetical protein
MYDKYKQLLDMDAYFSTWERENVEQISDELKQALYNKYRVKCAIFQRDSFTCQNIDCRSPQSRLTMHHVKWKKNGGEDKARNGVTLCRSCHAAYHQAKRAIIMADAPHLPPHIRGQTFKLVVAEPKKDWKALRAEMKALRSRLKQNGFRAVISWKDVYILMQWLFGYDEDGEDDD